MIEQISSGQVALIGGIAGDVTSQARLDGFSAAVDGQLEIVQTVAADWERQKALTAATDIMRANPDLKGFFAANDDMGLGIARAVANAGKTGEIAVISVDGNEDALKAVASGDLTATVAQYPYEIGALGVQACESVLAGQEVPTNIESPTALVTTENAQQAIDAFPAPFEEYQNPLSGS
jgi:ABC-type sugar transport system substrate-binding protein